jgi:hypothetical protein
MIETTKERWFETEVNRIAGEIALKTTELVAAKAEAYFERVLAVARQQQAKSWELRAATIPLGDMGPGTVRAVPPQRNFILVLFSSNARSTRRFSSARKSQLEGRVAS